MADRDRLFSVDFETEVPPEEEDYSVEEILTEYGGGLERKLSEGSESPAPGTEEAADEKRRGFLRLPAALEPLAERLGSTLKQWEAPLKKGAADVYGIISIPLEYAGTAVRKLASRIVDAIPENLREAVEDRRRALYPRRTRGRPVPVPAPSRTGIDDEGESLEEDGQDAETRKEEGPDDRPEDKPETRKAEAADTKFKDIEPADRDFSDVESAGEESTGEESAEEVLSGGESVVETASEAAGEDSEPTTSPSSGDSRKTGAKEAAEKSGANSSVPVEEVVGSTVKAVMEERKSRKSAPRKKKRFTLRKTEREPIGPEIPLQDAAGRFREAYTRRQVPPLALASAGLPVLLLLLEWAGASIPLWSSSVPLRSFVTLLCLGATAYFCRQVFTGSAAAFACGVSAAAAGCDCLVRIFFSARSPGDCYGAVACLAMIVAQWGVSLESRGRYETFRAASLDEEPPYLITDMEQGACKQRGATPGFYTTAMLPDRSSLWQTVLLPLTLTVSVVLAGLSSFGHDRPADFFLNWSAILAAGATFTLPLCWGVPWARLAHRLQRLGGAVAGWAGAEKISRRRAMIVTDGDLFPPGSIQLNGIRLFGEGMDKAVAYAAAMTRAAACALDRVFDELLRSELGERVDAEEFNFYEEGGYGAVIQGDEVLMGTAAFLRRMGVLLPRDLQVGAGMFLAVDHRLLAVFAIRYTATDNVDYALRLMRRSRIIPLLAVRDPNITPNLLQRKFRRRIPVRYPDLARRIALSEIEFDRDAPRALLYREGLLPFAEAVVGSRRLCAGVKRATILSELGSLAGMLLTFYLTSQAKYELLTPLSLIGFLLLWLVPVLLVMDLL